MNMSLFYDFFQSTYYVPKFLFYLHIDNHLLIFVYIIMPVIM